MRQGPTEPSDRLALRQARTWVVLGLSVAFLLIGALFILAPRWGATLFGIPAPEDRGLAYVQAIGVRDLALALYIIGLYQPARRLTHSGPLPVIGTSDWANACSSVQVGISPLLK